MAKNIFEKLIETAPAEVKKEFDYERFDKYIETQTESLNALLEIKELLSNQNVNEPAPELENDKGGE